MGRWPSEYILYHLNTKIKKTAEVFNISMIESETNRGAYGIIYYNHKKEEGLVVKSKSFRIWTILLSIVIALALIATGFPLGSGMEVSAEDNARTYKDEKAGEINIEGQYAAGETLEFYGEGINSKDEDRQADDGDVMTMLTGIDITGPFGFEKHISFTEQDDEDSDTFDEGEDEDYDSDEEYDSDYSSEDYDEDEDYDAEEPEDSDDDYYDEENESDEDEYGKTEDEAENDSNEIVLGAPGKYEITAHFDKYEYDRNAVSPEKEEQIQVEVFAGNMAAVIGAALAGNGGLLFTADVMKESAEAVKGDWEKTDEVDISKKITVKGEVIFDPVKGQSEQISKYYAPKKELGKVRKPVWNEHKFIGWYTKKKAGKRVNAETEIKFGNNESRTFYAHWMSKTRVLFKPGKGQVGKKVKKVWRNKKYGKLPKAKRSGFKFRGWYTKKHGGKKITANKKVPRKIRVVLYAHWTKRVKVIFKARKGKVKKHYKKLLAGSRYGKLPKA
ncbi:MAG: InlB B-repeat-containing protein, partial [Firmicutes bacterium]|nr:InlB B-repeat-containing protein [Bacillota bacterium]